MADLYLQALMKGEIVEKGKTSIPMKQAKNKFEIEADRQIEEYIKTLSFDGFPHDQLNSQALKRARMAAELKEAAKLPELSSYIETAFKLLYTGDQIQLDQFELMLEEFAKAKKILEEIDVNLLDGSNPQNFLHISQSSMDSIFTLAVTKFNENQMHDSLALFILLATLNPENPDYWYRSGIVAQQSENVDLALRLYKAASALDPSFLAPRIFSVECYLKSDLKEEALNQYAEVMKICETVEVDSGWKELILRLQEILPK